MNGTRLVKSGLAASSAKVAADGIAGLEANKAVNVSGALNNVAARSVRFIPRSIIRRIAGSMQAK
jgi:short-subunit dehydrogenase